MEINQWTLTKVLNRAQITPKTKNYNYNKMPCTNSKPALQAGNKNLEEYKASIDLHYSFCNPKKIIELIYDKASSREPFDWLYNKEYKGCFVINEITQTQIKQLKDVILYAKIEFNFIEFPVDDEYKDQIENSNNLDEYSKYSENSSKLKDFGTTVKNSIVENIKDTISNAPLSDNLSDRAKEIFESVKLKVISDIASDSIINIYENVNSITKNISSENSLNFSDIQNLNEAIQSIPDLMLDSALRRG